MHSNTGMFYKQMFLLLLLLLLFLNQFNLDQTYDIKIEDLKYNSDIDIKPFNFCLTNNDPILMSENYEGMY
jgi:hypothetical protein